MKKDKLTELEFDVVNSHFDQDLKEDRELTNSSRVIDLLTNMSLAARRECSSQHQRQGCYVCHFYLFLASSCCASSWMCRDTSGTLGQSEIPSTVVRRYWTI